MAEATNECALRSWGTEAPVVYYTLILETISARTRLYAVKNAAFLHGSAA